MTNIHFKKNGKKFWIDRFLVQKLDNIKMIQRKNWDCCFLIDGDERSGKSTMALTIAYYLYPTLTIKNIAESSEDAVKKLKELPDKSPLIIDEGSILFSAKDSMRKEQRELIKILNVIGQKNMILIIVLPCFFELNKELAVRRSRFLIHVYTDKKLTRGRFSYFSKRQKSILYEKGKKNYNSYKYPKAQFISTFQDFNPLGQEYIESKKRTLIKALDGDKKEQKKKIYEKRNEILKRRLNKIVRRSYRDKKYTQTQIAKILGIDRSNIVHICSK